MKATRYVRMLNDPVAYENNRNFDWSASHFKFLGGLNCGLKASETPCRDDIDLLTTVHQLLDQSYESTVSTPILSIRMLCISPDAESTFESIQKFLRVWLGDTTKEANLLYRNSHLSLPAGGRLITGRLYSRTERL